MSDGVGGFTGTENLNFTAATGLQIEANIQEALAVRYGTSAAGQRVGVCFQLWDSIGNEMCYARAYGEIIDSTDGIEKGGFVIQTLRSGTLTDAFYIGANGNVGIGDFAWDDKPARQLHVRGAVAAERVETMIQNTDETGFTSIRHFVGTTERGSFRCHGTTYIGSGTIFDSADMVQLKSVTAAGLSIAAENGPVRLFTGGLADANIRIHISSAGFTAFGAGVPRYMLDLYGTGSRLHLSTTDADSGVYIGSDAPNSLGIGAGAAFDGTVWKGKVAGNCSIMWMHAGIFGVYGQACTVGNNVTSVVTFEVGVGGVAGFGVASTSTARILLPAVTAGIEPVNMGAGAAALSPSTIRAGAIWLNVTNGLQFAKVAGTALVVATRSEDNAFSTVQTFAAPRGISFNGSTGVLSTAADFGFDPGVKQYIGYIQASKVYIPAIAVSAYSQVSAITVNTEQSILSASLMGGTTLPAPVLGQRYKVRASGLYSASVANTLTVRFKMSNSTVVTYTTPSAITAASVFVLELEVIWSSATVCIVFGLLTITPTAGGQHNNLPNSGNDIECCRSIGRVRLDDTALDGHHVKSHLL